MKILFNTLIKKLKTKQTAWERAYERIGIAFEEGKEDQHIFIRFLIDVVRSTILTGIAMSIGEGKPANMLFACWFFMFCMTVGCFLFEMGEIILRIREEPIFDSEAEEKEFFDELIFFLIRFIAMFAVMYLWYYDLSNPGYYLMFGFFFIYLDHG